MMEGTRAVEIVVKVGGGLLADPRTFQDTLDEIGAMATRHRTVIIPGGGPFADAVRDVDKRLQLSPTAAHWMAILGMDQYAHLIGDRLRQAQVVVDRAGVLEAFTHGTLPVLAPSRWLVAADPLPHSWEVTSDSLAAWLAGELGASRLLLVKPANAQEPLLDSYFARALPQRLKTIIVRAGEPLDIAAASC